MSKEFQEKLQLYKEGKLNETEAEQIEAEIDKFLAISDYLNEDEKDFLEALRQQAPMVAIGENKTAKVFKRKVNLRIILLTAFSAFSVLAAFIFIYFTASKLTTAMFALDYKEMFVKRQVVAQFAQMFQPKYNTNGIRTTSSLFAKQGISIYLENTVGRTKIEETQVNVKYSFGKPVKAEEGPFPPLIFENFAHFTPHEPNQLPGFKILENAPQGTKSKIYVEFNKALTAQEIKENFINVLSTPENERLDFTPIAAVGSELALANSSYFKCRTYYPFDKNASKQEQEMSLKAARFESMDNDAHKESLIGNLKLIKNNLRLLQVMYYEDMFNNVNFDDMIKQVENNGAQYVGMYISADSKELLKLKGSSIIHCMAVENIVIW